MTASTLCQEYGTNVMCFLNELLGEKRRGGNDCKEIKKVLPPSMFSL